MCLTIQHITYNFYFLFKLYCKQIKGIFISKGGFNAIRVLRMFSREEEGNRNKKLVE